MSASTQPTIQEQKRFWDWHWQNWQERKTVNDWKQKRHEMVLNFVKSVSGDGMHILEVGCGPGWYTDKFAVFGKVTGIDLSDEAIKMARSQFPHIDFIAGDVYSHSLPPRHFDVVVAQEVIDHVQDSAVFLDLVAEALKPGGFLVFSCTNKYVVDRLDEEEFPSQPDAHIGRYFDTKTLKPLLKHRFKCVRLETIIPIGRRGILRILNSYKLNRLFEMVLHRNLIDRLKEQAGFGYQIVVLAQRKP